MKSRLAVVLFNLGGPDSLDAVRPFLFNLFNDPAILRQGGLARWFLARLIARRRAGAARAIYRRLGGRSPLLEQTRAQATALQDALADLDAAVFVCMRYWHPMVEQVVEEVARCDAQDIVLLPLYPQFSTTTTASSLRQWRGFAAGRLDAPCRAICCYPDEPGFIEALAVRLEAVLAAWSGPPPRILYSAHGIPKAFVATGDPYPDQVERTAAALRRRLARADLDQVVCYQSRVGPLEWTGPYTDREIARAGAEGTPLVVVPVAFVSEHSETLVELDQDYRALAERSGVPRYERVATVGTDPRFIAALAQMVRAAAARPAGRTAPGAPAVCPTACTVCPAAQIGRPHVAP